MSETAFLFSGQGENSIQVGMGHMLYKEFIVVQNMFSDATRFLGFSLSEICFNGPEDKLLKTRVAQPASFVVGLACARFLDKSKQADFLAGFSVGYITALVYARVITFSQGLAIIQERARLMAEACQIIPGRMVALIKPTNIKMIQKICKQFDVEIANYISSTLIVISGRYGPVGNASACILQRGFAREGVLVEVEGAFHSRHMKRASVLFGNFLKKIIFEDPRIPIIANSNAKIITNGKKAKKEAVKHLWNPVLWQKSVENLLKKGVDTFYEASWGDVLSSNLERDFKGKDIKIFSVQKILEQTA